MLRAIHNRAEVLEIIRKKPLRGYDISVLLTQTQHLTDWKTQRAAIEFILSLSDIIIKEVQEIRLDVWYRGRAFTSAFYEQFDKFNN